MADRTGSGAVTGSIAVAMCLLASALVVWPPVRLLDRAACAGSRPTTQRAARPDGDPFEIAAALDMFAVCLRAGLPVGTAIRTVVSSAPNALGAPLCEVADLLDLGADPRSAWAVLQAPGRNRRRRDPTPAEVALEALAAMAVRSARAGSSLAGGLTELADDIRRRAHDRAVAAAERAGVTISAPLGLCFLPAFVCLGIVPVVIGLASGVLSGS